MRGPGTRMSGPERRRQLLAVARAVFGAEGYRATSMNDVARAAGVTKPVLYQHFDSKEELFLELVRDVAADVRAVVREALAAAEGPRQQVESGFAAYFRFFAAEPGAFRLLFGDAARGEPLFASVVADLERDIAADIAQLFPPDLPLEDRLLFAHGIVGLAESTSRYCAELRPGYAPDELAAKVARLAWLGLRQGGPATP